MRWPQPELDPVAKPATPAADSPPIRPTSHHRVRPCPPLPALARPGPDASQIVGAHDRRQSRAVDLAWLICGSVTGNPDVRRAWVRFVGIWLTTALSGGDCGGPSAFGYFRARLISLEPCDLFHYAAGVITPGPDWACSTPSPKQPPGRSRVFLIVATVVVGVLCQGGVAAGGWLLFARVRTTVQSTISPGLVQPAEPVQPIVDAVESFLGRIEAGDWKARTSSCLWRPVTGRACTCSSSSSIGGPGSSHIQSTTLRYSKTTDCYPPM